MNWSTDVLLCIQKYLWLVSWCILVNWSTAVHTEVCMVSLLVCTGELLH